MMDFLDSALDVIGSAVSSVGSALDDLVGNWIGKALYYIARALCELIRAVYSIFSVFAGITKVNIQGDYQYLTNFFFENDMVSGIYWGMVMIGVALVFGFAIVSVIRKMFDLYDKQQQSLGQILSGCFKSILIMLCMTIIMSAAMSLTNELVRRVNYIFDRNKDLTTQNEIVFTDEQFATMARVLNTIGNYSLNPSYDQRYNLNACYNEIRPDLLILQEEGVFDLMYADPEGKEKASWQSALEELALAGNPSELMMDAYYEQVSKSLKNIMDIMRTDADFHPLESYQRQQTTTQGVSLDRILFLSGTMSAANNEVYNLDPSFNDAARGPFLTGDKDIYNIDDVNKVFDLHLGGISYMVIFFVGFFVLKDLWRCIMNCTSRMINIVGLYIIAPPVAAAIPLDDGQKFREWRTAMVIQMLGIFGAIIPMRLVLLFVPMIMDSDFVLLPSVSANLFGKVALIVGLLEGVDRFGSVLTGILANNAGQEAIRASNLNEASDQTFDKYVGQHVPFMRNFFSDRYQQKMAAANQGGSGSTGGSSGGSFSGTGGSGGSGSSGGLPTKVPQGDSMSAMSGAGAPGTLRSDADRIGTGLSSGGFGGLPGRVPGGNSMNSSNSGGNSSLNSSNQMGSMSSNVSNSGGLPGKTPGGVSMNASNSAGGMSVNSSEQLGGPSANISNTGGDSASVQGGDTGGGLSSLPDNAGSGFSDANETAQFGGGSNDSFGGFAADFGSLPENMGGFADSGSDFLDGSASGEFGSGFEGSFGAGLPDNAGGFVEPNDSFGDFVGGMNDSFGAGLPDSAGGFAEHGSGFLDGSASQEFGGINQSFGAGLPGNAGGIAANPAPNGPQNPVPGTVQEPSFGSFSQSSANERLNSSGSRQPNSGEHGRSSPLPPKRTAPPPRRPKKKE